MSHNYKFLCSNLNQISIDKLAKHQKRQSSSSTNYDKSKNYQNQKSIEVVSPFYQRSKCQHRGPCLCPFHKKKAYKQRIILNSKTKRNTQGQKINNSFNRLSLNKNEQRLYTENNQKSTLNQENWGWNRQSQLFGKFNLTDVSHKVDCRNLQFQEYLERKMFEAQSVNQQSVTEQENKKIDQLQFRHSQNEQKFPNDFSYRYQNKRNQKSPKISKFSSIDQPLTNNLTRNGLLNKLRQNVQSIIKGTKRFHRNKLEGIKQQFYQLISKQKQLKGQSKVYLKSMAVYEKLETFMKQKEVIKQNQGSQREYNQGISQKSINKCELRQQMATNDDEIESRNKKKKKKRTGLLLTQNIQICQNQNDENNLRKKHVGFRKTLMEVQEQKQRKKGLKNDQQISQDIKNKKGKKTQNGQINQFSINLKQNELINQENSNENTSGKMNSKQKRNRMRRIAKFQENSINPNNDGNIEENQGQQEMIEKRVLVRNRKFLRKMQLKLKELSLTDLVIENADTVLIKKKKMRCLKQLILKRPGSDNNNEQVYDQLLKYLDIYTEHLHYMIKKDIIQTQNNHKSNKTNKSCAQISKQQQQKLFTRQDFLNNLKFYNLHQIEHQFINKKSSLGFTPICQYTTNDKSRNKMKLTLQYEAYKKQNQDHKKRKLSQSKQNQDVLVQIGMENKYVCQDLYQYWNKNQCFAKEVQKYKKLNQETNQRVQKVKKRIKQITAPF